MHFQSLQANVADPEAVVLAAEESPLPSVEEVGLRVENTELLPLKFSSQSEVFRFDLRADTPYSLRYISLYFWSEGLREDIQNPEAWSVYEVEKGRTDYSKKVGQGELLEEGVLRLRFFNEPSQAYRGEKGIQAFVLSAPVLSDEANPQLNLRLPEQGEKLPELLDWRWTPGHPEGSWMSIEDVYGFYDVAF